MATFDAPDPVEPFPEPDDLVLIRAIAEQDEYALRLLFERHAPWLSARLRQKFPAHAVEDVVQETFLAVWRSAARYGGQGDVGGWIWGIARRQSAQWLRTHQPTGSAVHSDLRWLIEPTSGPEEAAIVREDVRQAFLVLGPAGSPQRELALQAFVEDRPLAEIANELHVPTGTIKSRLHHIRRRMRAALGEEKSS